MDSNYCFTCEHSYASISNLNRHFRTMKHNAANDYAHCATCDISIDLNHDVFYTDQDNTYCKNDKPEEA